VPMTYSTKKNQAPESNIKTFGLGSKVVHPLTNSTHRRHIICLGVDTSLRWPVHRYL